MAAELGDYGSSIGRERHDRAVIEALVAARLAATLDQGNPPSDGDCLPPAWHWAYFFEVHRHSALSSDGRGAEGGLLPELPGLSRMWAGGAFRVSRLLRIGEAARRVSRVLSIEPKEGRTGRLVLATIEHRIAGGDGEAAFTEEQRLVFREPQPLTGAEPGDSVAEKPLWRRTVKPDPVMLFRFSALTFNAHRIHYDHPYTTAVEGYPALLVHGPLTAMLLLELLRREARGCRLVRFDYRATRPLFVDREISLCGSPAPDGRRVALWAEDHRGYVAMRGEAEVE